MRLEKLKEPDAVKAEKTAEMKIQSLMEENKKLELQKIEAKKAAAGAGKKKSASKEKTAEKEAQKVLADEEIIEIQLAINNNLDEAKRQGALKENREKLESELKKASENLVNFQRDLKATDDGEKLWKDLKIHLDESLKKGTAGLNQLESARAGIKPDFPPASQFGNACSYWLIERGAQIAGRKSWNAGEQFNRSKGFLH